MIKSHQKSFHRLQMLADMLVVAAVYVLAYFFRFYVLNSDVAHKSFLYYLNYLIYIIPGYAVIFYSMGLYSGRHTRSRVKYIVDVVWSNALAVIYVLALLYLLKEVDISRRFIALFAAANCVLDIAVRFVLHKIFSFLRKSGRNLKHILIVGYSKTAEGYIDRVRANPQWGYSIKGILDDYMAPGTRYKGALVIGKISELEEKLEELSPDELIIALRFENYGMLADIVALGEKAGIHTRFAPDFQKVITTNPEIEDMDGLPIINIRRVPLENMGNRMIKRLGDILFSLLAIIILGIPMIVIAILVKATSKGPVIYKQTRVGLNRREFEMYKFRSMRVMDEKEEKKEWTTWKDDRVTKVGKFIRKTSLDELPQFFNVLKGDMSIVGPRPERPYFVEKFKEEIPRYMIKHQVRPGITGWAQVNGYRGDTSIIRRIDYDIYYIENWNVGFDLIIMIKTLFRTTDRNAY